MNIRRQIQIAFVGDVMLGRLVSRELGRKPAAHFWGDVGPLLRRADAVIANLECAITTSQQPWQRTPKVFHFGADPKAVEVLQAGNVRGVSLANNHVLDFEVAGFRDTLRLLDRAGIAHAGAGETVTEARAPALIELEGATIGLLAVTDNEPPFAAGPTRPGVAYIELENDVETLPPSAAEIASLRRAGAGLVVVSCHLGPSMLMRPSARIQDYHRALAVRGADIVHGHSAHLVQGVELTARSLILHDTGDFLDDYAVDKDLRNDWSFVFLVDLAPEGVKRLTLVPVLLSFAEVNLAPPGEREPLCARMKALSSKFGVALQECDEGLRVDLF